MRVYVESNFVLELTLAQEQHGSCEEILKLCVAGFHSLLTPAFCIPESYHALVGKGKSRKNLVENFQAERGQLARSAFYRSHAAALEEVESLLSRSVDAEVAQFHSRVEKVLQVATLVPLDAEVLQSAAALRETGTLTQSFDSIVLASVLADARRFKGEASCFLNRNSKEFAEPEIETRLAELGCKILFSFDDGLGYLTKPNS